MIRRLKYAPFALALGILAGTFAQAQHCSTDLAAATEEATTVFVGPNLFFRSDALQKPRAKLVFHNAQREETISIRDNFTGNKVALTGPDQACSSLSFAYAAIRTSDHPEPLAVAARSGLTLKDVSGVVAKAVDAGYLAFIYTLYDLDDADLPHTPIRHLLYLKRFLEVDETHPEQLVLATESLKVMKQIIWEVDMYRLAELISHALEDPFSQEGWYPMFPVTDEEDHLPVVTRDPPEPQKEGAP